jgi:hypothetical protein
VPTDQLTRWAVDHPWPTVGVTAAALITTAAALWLAIRTIRRWDRPPTPVIVAAAGAVVCTAYSGDTSWRFAGDRLGMHDTTERAVMFAAGELALLACAVMARANKAATATQTEAGSPGVPGVLVWVITGVQVIPCYATSGLVGGTVRAIIGPVMAGLLWHLAMGLEIRVVRPEALSTGLPAMLGREIRERLLSYLGLATRDRTAEQISRDRATARAVRLAARPRLHGWGRRRLAAAVARACVGTNGEQRHQLLQALAARRTAGELTTVPLRSPWTSEEVSTEPHPSTALGVAGAHLRRMDPIDAIERVRVAHPAATPAELAALCTEYGVPVSETQVRIAIRAGNPPRLDSPHAPMAEQALDEPAPEPDEQPVLSFDAAAAKALALAPATAPAEFVLDLAPMHPPIPELTAPVGALAASRARVEVHARIPDPEPECAEPGPEPESNPGPAPDEPAPAPEFDELVRRGRELAKTGRLTLKRAKRELRIGQPKAQDVIAIVYGRTKP